jgi:hypothetical protein
MTAKQTAKHIADREATEAAYNSLNVPVAVGPTPDGLGLWEGGIAHSPIDGHKAKAQRTGDTKNTPGTDYPSKIGPEHQKGYSVESMKVLEGMPVPVRTEAFVPEDAHTVHEMLQGAITNDEPTPSA